MVVDGDGRPVALPSKYAWPETDLQAAYEQGRMPGCFNISFMAHHDGVSRRSADYDVDGVEDILVWGRGWGKSGQFNFVSGSSVKPNVIGRAPSCPAVGCELVDLNGDRKLEAIAISQLAIICRVYTGSGFSEESDWTYLSQLPINTYTITVPDSQDHRTIIIGRQDGVVQWISAEGKLISQYSFGVSVTGLVSLGKKGLVVTTTDGAYEMLNGKVIAKRAGSFAGAMLLNTNEARILLWRCDGTLELCNVSILAR